MDVIGEMFDRYVGCGMSGKCYRYIAFVQLNEDRCDYFVLSFRVLKFVRI